MLTIKVKCPTDERFDLSFVLYDVNASDEAVKEGVLFHTATRAKSLKVAVPDYAKFVVEREVRRHVEKPPVEEPKVEEPPPSPPVPVTTSGEHTPVEPPPVPVPVPVPTTTETETEHHDVPVKTNADDVPPVTDEKSDKTE